MKKLVFLTLIISTLAFSNFNWHNTKELENIDNVAKIGDILIYKPSNKSFVQRWGHCMLVINNHKIVDFPRLSYGFREVPYRFLKDQDREFLILRFKGINDEIRKKLLNEAYKYQYYNYNPLAPDLDMGLTFCSQFIAKVFENTVGGVVDYNAPIVMPTDFLNSKYFEVIEF